METRKSALKDRHIKRMVKKMGVGNYKFCVISGFRKIMRTFFFFLINKVLGCLERLFQRPWITFS